MDAPKGIFLVEKRLENLAAHERCQRLYQKHTQQYWETDIIENRAKCARISQETAPTAQDDIIVDNMMAEEIKQKLIAKGIKTHIR